MPYQRGERCLTQGANVLGPERQRAVLNLLQDLRGIDTLKALFWSELNYKRTNRPLSRASWGQEAASALLNDPTLFATGGDDFQVIHARLDSDRLLLQLERLVVTRMLQNHPYALFVFSNRSDDRWHFVNVKYDDHVKRRRLFRRITIGPHEVLRTASERLAMLDIDAIGVGQSTLSALTIQQQHDLAFDVEPVTQEFFAEYAAVFREVEGAIKGMRDTNRKRLFTQRLFNRLMFVAFIQKKGWLQYQENRDYLPALWKAHGKHSSSTKNFYQDRLKPLFFRGLNTRNDGSSSQGRAKLHDLIGPVPYLNGGLFEESEDDTNDTIVVPDKAIASILRRLFGRFNFTVSESTPLDVEVAVDPEMLGKIFEELVTARHATGSYYTPKPVVSFMCREALKGYLESTQPSESKTSIAQFVDLHDAATLRNAGATLDGLRRIKVCDPACGSGAYLVGMMHELLDLRLALFASTAADAISVYDRKVEIIQNSLYGVDIDPFAINIARLRLWLSLSVDYEGSSPEPLPNLDYKVEVGDSLTSSDPSGGAELGFRGPLVTEFHALKSQYLTAHGGEKVNLRRKITEVRQGISSWARGSSKVVGFDWAVEFAEVFAEGGFDIIVANPPYVSALEFAKTYDRDYRAVLNDRFVSARGAYDLFVPFMERGVTLLKRDGILAFITPNKYLAASYGIALRDFILREAELQCVVDLSSVPVFSAASVYPVLTFIKRGKAEGPYNVQTRVPPPGTESSDPLGFVRSSFESQMLSLLPENIWGFLLSNNADLLMKLITDALPLARYGDINATTTAAEADQFGAHLRGSKIKNSVKVVNTGTIEAYHTLWGISPMTHSGQRFVTPYLSLNANAINERRAEMYTSPKVIFAKLARQCEAMFDAVGEYAALNVNCFYRPFDSRDLKYVAAFANSKIFMFIYDQFFRALRMSGGYYQFQSPQLRVMPLRNASSEFKQAIGKLVDRIMMAPVPHPPTPLLKEVDKKFFELYGLNETEIAKVEAL